MKSKRISIFEVLCRRFAIINDPRQPVNSVHVNHTVGLRCYRLVNVNASIIKFIHDFYCPLTELQFHFVRLAIACNNGAFKSSGRAPVYSRNISTRHFGSCWSNRSDDSFLSTGHDPKPTSGRSCFKNCGGSFSQLFIDIDECVPQYLIHLR